MVTQESFSLGIIGCLSTDTSSSHSSGYLFSQTARNMQFPHWPCPKMGTTTHACWREESYSTDRLFKELVGKVFLWRVDLQLKPFRRYLLVRDFVLGCYHMCVWWYRWGRKILVTSLRWFEGKYVTLGGILIRHKPDYIEKKSLSRTSGRHDGTSLIVQQWFNPTTAYREKCSGQCAEWKSCRCR